MSKIDARRAQLNEMAKKAMRGDRSISLRALMAENDKLLNDLYEHEGQFPSKPVFPLDHLHPDMIDEENVEQDHAQELRGIGTHPQASPDVRHFAHGGLEELGKKND